MSTLHPSTAFVAGASPEVEYAPLASLVPSGRVVELSAAIPQGRLTIAVDFVRLAQHAGEHCAWVQRAGAGLFPPDLAAAGVLLDELVVVHTPESAGVAAVARAAELLLRSDGFGLVVLDLTEAAPRGESWVQRLGGLCRRHGTRAVLLTSQPATASSAGALVAVRVELQRHREGDGYVLEPVVLRDRCDLAWRLGESVYAPPGVTP